MLVNTHFYRLWKPSEGYPFSTKLLLRDHHAVVTRFLHFKVKTKNGKRKFKRILSFLFVEEGKLFIKKSSFEDVCMYIVSWTFYTFFSSALKKNYKMRSDLNFAMCSADFTCVNGSTIQIVLRELL